MKLARLGFLLATTSLAQVSSTQLPLDDAIRVAEFYRLAAQLDDQLWDGWSKTPTPLLLVTGDTEFLTHHPAPPKEFHQIGDDWCWRPRRFPINLLATFSAFGPPSVIVIGEPQNTESKTSTPWLFTLVHEHFHQLQNSQPNYFSAVEKLGLSKGDSSGMWMLNYRFPYEQPQVVRDFGKLRDWLISSLEETDPLQLRQKAAQYVERRKQFLAGLTADDRKYLAFQLWQEGIARYTQVKAAEAAAQYRPSPEYKALGDFESFADYAGRARKDTLEELRRIDIARAKRTVIYSFGAGEGFLLDRIHPQWKQEYFHYLLSTDELFENAVPEGSAKRRACGVITSVSPRPAPPPGNPPAQVCPLQWKRLRSFHSTPDHAVFWARGWPQ